MLALQRWRCRGRALARRRSSTIGGRIAALEGALDARIALRHSDGIRLAEAGEAVASAAVHIETAIADLSNRIGGGASLSRGHVRIAATESTANFIYGGLARLREEHPEITFALVVSSSAINLSRGDADLAVRMFRESRGDLITRKIGEMGWSVYASHRCFEKHRCPSIDSFEGHDLVGYADAPARSPGGACGWRRVQEGARVVMRGTTVTTVMQSTMAGMGDRRAPVPRRRRIAGSADRRGHREDRGVPAHPAGSPRDGPRTHRRRRDWRPLRARSSLTLGPDRLTLLRWRPRELRSSGRQYHERLSIR